MMLVLVILSLICELKNILMHKISTFNPQTSLKTGATRCESLFGVMVIDLCDQDCLFSFDLVI